MNTEINTEDRLAQATFAKHLEKRLGCEWIYDLNYEAFGLGGKLGRIDIWELVLKSDLRRIIRGLIPERAIEFHTKRNCHLAYASYLLLPRLMSWEVVV